MDWRKLFGFQQGHALQFFQPKSRDSNPIVQPPLEVYEAGIAEWRTSLVGQFLGAAPNFNTMQRMIENLWNNTSKGIRVQVSFAGRKKSISLSKRGKGRPVKTKPKNSLKGSSNRFEVLSTVDETSSSLDDLNRKPRRIWFLWTKGLNLSLCHSTAQSITVKGFSQGQPFYITAIYGYNDGSQRRLLWQHLIDLDSRIGSFPWILGGDFNIILHPSESSDHDIIGSFVSTDMKDFQDTIIDLLLQYHPYFGSFFNWSNKQKDSFLARKLDIVLVNSNWITTYKNFFVEFVAPKPSDHYMAIQTVHGNPMMSLFHKLKRLKTSLKTLNKECFSNISIKVKQKKAELEQFQLSTLHRIGSIDSELRLQTELTALEVAENQFLKQKAKVQWLKEGDKCTKFYHSIIASKNKRDTIRILENEQGCRLETFDDISSEIIQYFKNLLGKANPLIRDSDHQFFKNLLQYNLSPENSAELDKDITSKEIKDVIFSQGNDKAPGPDGFTPLFFKLCWSVVGEDVIKAVKYFFSSSFLLPAFNSTIIALVPKSSNPSKVKDYRPIS
ncbi:uncharacterized protein LOC120144735 [Hibiscus syriacus]|uniref:uncharacterized protein LOC120144735 n=1 Tax=Hibiscus syriacus TaxID=106335 RepID=UPI001922F16D|nr:uncharacterized protein LOC120144735 [Hibiscus syriacus]